MFSDHKAGLYVYKSSVHWEINSCIHKLCFQTSPQNFSENMMSQLFWYSHRCQPYPQHMFPRHKQCWCRNVEVGLCLCLQELISQNRLGFLTIYLILLPKEGVGLPNVSLWRSSGHGQLRRDPMVDPELTWGIIYCISHLAWDGWIDESCNTELLGSSYIVFFMPIILKSVQGLCLHLSSAEKCNNTWSSQEKCVSESRF